MSLTDRLSLLVHQMIEPFKKILVRKPMTSQDKINPTQALKWCQNFLCGTWSTITAEQIQLNRITGGLSNYLYCCSLPDDVETQANEPRKVLLKIYGESHRKHRSTLLIDSIVCTLLSERKLGPHVYGIFPDGRLEEFVEAEALTVEEIRDAIISKKAGQLLGELHQLDMPLVKEPIWLFKIIERYLADLPIDGSRFQNEKNRLIFEEIRTVCNFPEEFQQLKKILSTVDSPVCFTHNDFQPGNILRLTNQADNFTIIDFEYCSYNYRGFDIGNHFCEFMFDYQSATEWPFFKVNFLSYPNAKQQRNFLSAYVDVLIQNQDQSFDSLTPNRDELIEQVMKEANFFALASHFFWTVWAIHMATSTTIKFGYMEYARARLTGYILQRDMLTADETQMPPQFTEELLRSTKNPFHKSYLEIVN